MSAIIFSILIPEDVMAAAIYFAGRNWPPKLGVINSSIIETSLNTSPISTENPDYGFYVPSLESEDLAFSQPIK
jgi:hypothetical protein